MVLVLLPSRFDVDFFHLLIVLVILGYFDIHLHFLCSLLQRDVGRWCDT
ncbi:hypothetical protein [Sporisorium scitamineum]|uniref:Uncharacterized protein n=1 Tax=Sporisorium scitamineum TaxID=49012 RepID=A0A0F7SDR7_9BASI|nr:hypothetical protein [Sporisorium scitamineum]